MAKLTAQEEAADPTTPSTGDWILYFKSGGLYIIDDTGTVTGPLSAGGLSDGDKGDITVASSGASWTIDSDVVSLSKMANMATASLLGRNTAGTGAPEVLSASTVKTLLSLVPGTDVQAYDAELAALAGLTSAADKFPYFTGSGTASLLTIVSAIRTVLASADLATFRSNAGLAIGTNVQAWDTDLDTWATKTPPSGTAVGTSDTQTLTNKRVDPRVGTTTSSATPTINTDNYDAYSITAQAAAITSFTTNLSGTPVNFQKLIIRIKDDGTARAITWGTSFEAKGVALPTTTVISKVLTVGFIYDTVTSKWGCVASAQEA